MSENKEPISQESVEEKVNEPVTQERDQEKVNEPIPFRPREARPFNENDLKPADDYEVVPEYSEAFKVTPVDFGEKPKSHSEKYGRPASFVLLQDFRKQAEDDGYAESVIEAALKEVTEDVNTYAKFENLLNKVISDFEMQEAEITAKLNRIKRSIDIEITKLCKITDIAEYADSLITKVYETTAVVSLDLLKAATDEELQLDLYQEPIFSIILQINKEWVAEKVAKILAGWETREYPKKFVESYLRSLGVKEEDFDKNKADLIKFLPNNLQTEKSPDAYKQFKSVQLIQQQKNPEESIDLSEKIFSQTMQMIEYDATLQKEMEEGTPSLAATACATEAAIESMPEELKNTIKPSGIVGTAGAFCGKVVSLKYKTAKNFNDMLYESMGEYGDVWLANREESAKRKEELKQRKAELKLEEAIRKEEFKTEQKEIRRAQKAEEKAMKEHYKNMNNNVHNYGYDNSYGYNNGRGNYVRNNYTNNQRGINISPNIPLPLIVALINVILGFIVFLAFGKQTFTFTLFGLILSFVGFLKLRASEKGALLTIFGGYALALIAVLL